MVNWKEKQVLIKHYFLDINGLTTVVHCSKDDISIVDVQRYVKTIRENLERIEHLINLKNDKGS